MKNQRMGRLSCFRTVARTSLLVFMLVLCFCALALVSFAESEPAAGGVESLSFAEDVGVSYDSVAKYWGKTYDGVSEIDPEKVALTVVGQSEDNKPVVIFAGFIAANTSDAQTDVGVARLRVVYEWDGVEREYTAPARIEKRLLTWKDVSLDVRFTYDPAKGTYSHTFTDGELSSVTLASLDGVLAADAEKLSLGAVNAITVDAAEAIGVLTSKEPLRLYTSCVLAGEAASNYMLEGIEVSVGVDPCRITEVIWGIDGVATEGPLEFSYGDADAYLVTAVGKIGENDYRELIVKVKGTDVTLPQADAQTYGDVREEPYVLYAESANPDFFVLDGNFEASVTFKRAECVISVSDIVFEQDAEHDPEFYALPIQNPDSNVPAAVFARIGYKFTLDGVNFTDALGTTGVYTVQFFLHPDDEARYTLTVEETGENTDGVIQVTLLPYRLMAGTEAGRADVIVYNEKSDLGGIEATVTLAENLPDALLKRFTVYRGITLHLTGTEATDVFKLIIPVHSDLLADADTYALTAADLYVLDGEELKPLKDTCTVTLSEDGSHYVVSGVAASGTELSMTLLIAPAYRVSFWATAPGVALIVFLVLLLVMVLILIGLRLIRAEKRGGNPVLTVDTEGNAAKPKPAEAPETLGSADACIKEGLEVLAEALEDKVDPEAPAQEHADASAEVAETMGTTLTEAAALRLTDDSEERALEEAERLTEAMAEEKAKEFLANEAPATKETTADAKSVKGAVAEALNEALDAARAESDSVETLADAEALPHLRETVDAIVVEALAATVQLPEGLREIESGDAGEAYDVRTQVEHSVGEAIRTIKAAGALKLNEGVDADAIAKAVADAARSYTPGVWEDDEAREVTETLTAVLKAHLLK